MEWAYLWTICVKQSINSRWRITLASVFIWRQCILCGYFYRIRKRKKKPGNVTVTFGLGCQVCSFRERKRVYYNQFLLDFANKYHFEGEWKVNPDDSNFPERIERTLKFAYKALGPIIAEDVFLKALQDYWYKNYFIQERSLQS
jgi:hypothetical protein